MLRRKDFEYMNVLNLEGKKIGVVTDICLDYYNSKIIGFYMNKKGIFNKLCFIKIEDVVTLNNDMIITKFSREKSLPFSEIKDMEVINKKGEIIGVAEDLLIDPEDFVIKGMIVSSGIIDKIYKGKNIILLEDSMLGDNSIFYYGKDNVSLKTLPHNIKYV